MKNTPLSQFSPEELHDFRTALKSYFMDEFEMDIGDLQADLFIEFLNEKIGKRFYNSGVTAAIASLKDKTEDLYLLLHE